MFHCTVNYISVISLVARHSICPSTVLPPPQLVKGADLFLIFNGDGFQSMVHTISSTTPIFFQLVNLPFAMRGRPEFMLMPLIMPGALRVGVVRRHAALSRSF